MKTELSTILLFPLYISYWLVLSILIDGILEKPKLKHWHWLIVGACNAVILYLVACVNANAMLLCGVMLLLMLVQLFALHKDSFAGALLCTLACAMHIIAVFEIVISIFSFSLHISPYEILTNSNNFLLCCVISFLLLDFAILCVIKIVPLSKVKLINQHTEQRWFIIFWMLVNCIFLIYMFSLLYNPEYPINLSSSQAFSGIASLAGLYIVLFFSIKTSSLLGYKEKNVMLEQAIHSEQQYRKFMVRDAIVSYEVNVTQNIMLKGFEEYGITPGKAYTDLLVLMTQKILYSEDTVKFVRECGRTNILRLFERGERELLTEYRRISDNGEYIWVRAIINLSQDTQTGDVMAFVCVKNIDDEKRGQMELLRQAQRDPLTNLFNRSTVAKLIDEHISVFKNSTESALFMIDVDNFKEINDNLGHIFGDAVLCELAEKLTHIFRATDVVGRVGGDEFIVFLKDRAAVAAVQQKASEICRVFHAIYQGAASQTHTISASIGIALFPKDGGNFLELYSNADVALYSVKNDGKNGYKLYDGSGFSAYTSQRTEIQTIGNISQKSFRENRIEYVFKMLYQSGNPYAAIRSILELVARHFSFERGYVFETAKDGKTSSNTFEWCAPGVKREINNMQNIPVEVVATAHAHFQQDGIFVLKSLDDLQPVERELLESQGIKSMFQFGILDKSRLLGFIGFDNCTSSITPSDTEIDEMKTICNILATFFVKQYIDEISEKDLLARQEVMNNLENFIYVINVETFELLFTNEKIQALLSTTEKQNKCYSFFRGKSCQCEDCPMLKLTQSKADRMVCEIYNDKLSIWMETSASLMRWTDGTLACLINCTDITKQKTEHLLHVDQLEKLLYVDPLTGGRTYQKFQIDMQRNIDKLPKARRLLVKMDIANFKLINQIYGFDKGNEILSCVAKALNGTIRNENEMFARINNDDFVVLFTIKNNNEIEELYQTFLNLFGQIVGDDFSFRCKFPQGRYIIEPDAIKNITVHDMYEMVNIAHKTAKQRKTVDFVFYNEQMTNEALRVKEIENKMALALQNNEFIVYLQPKYYLEDETIAGAEALSRWGETGSSQFSPSAFIPVFEQNGFITKLDFYVFEKTCKTIKSWKDSGLQPVRVSVNFSRLHLDNANFVKQLCEIADGLGVDRQYLEIEITETVIFDNIDMLVELLEDLHKCGFSMSIDDFGSGYSSLGMLKDFPVDVIKMDRSFFANQRDAQRSKIVLNNIIKMANDLGIRIVAEGVEEQDQIDFLRELKCDMVQGYYYAKPMPTTEFTKLLSANANP